MLFLSCDLSQAEARVVYALSHDPELLTIARSNPWEYDTHKFNASIIFSKAEGEVTGTERRASKGIVHGTHYYMLPARMSDTLMLENFIFTPQECEVFQKRYLAARPGVGKWQQATITKLIQTRKLESSWGWEIKFPYERLDWPLYRRGLAWRPQHEVGVLTNAWGLIPLYYNIKFAGRWSANVKSDWEAEYADQFKVQEPWLREALTPAYPALKTRINLQVHDEVVCSTPPREMYFVGRFLKHCLERERGYDGESLAIPVEFAAGKNWSKAVEWKRFPEDEKAMMDSIKPLLG